MKILKINRTYLLYSLVVSIIIFMISKDYGMFWDNVLFGSKMGNQLYYNSIFDWTMPDEFDPGHPPFLGFLLAISWKIFGHKLWVAHLTMLPFVLGTFYNLIVLVNHFIKNRLASILCVILIVADPTLGVTFVSVNPEIIILYFLLITINGLIQKNTYKQYLGLLFLSIISFRSMMLFGGIILFEVYHDYFIRKKSFSKIITLSFILKYTITSLPGVIFVLWRLNTKGWLQTHPNSPWVDYWHFPTIKIAFKNLALVIHRYIDFGRVFLLLFLLLSIIFLWKKLDDSKKEKLHHLISLGLISVFWILLACIFSTNAFGHRYFLISFITFSLAAFIILQDLKYFKILYNLLLIGLLTGNFWVYPIPYAQGWNATLGHLPYHKLRLEAIQYLDDNKIPIENVASFFPNYNSIDRIDLSGDSRTFSKFNNKSEYVFYSNVYNLTDEQYDLLDKNYTEFKNFKKYPVNIRLLKLKSKK